MFRGQSKTDFAFEWENITGALLSAMACFAQSGETWDKSISMPGPDQYIVDHQSDPNGPSRFISLMADLPSLESPPWTGPIFEVDESANALLQTCVKVHYQQI